jgi:hypothetical protein
LEGPVVGLRDEFIEKNQALGVFVVELNIFTGTRTDDGSVFNKLIVFDEAHKYITNSDLTPHVVEVIRQMRHQGVYIELWTCICAFGCYDFLEKYNGVNIVLCI